MHATCVDDEEIEITIGPYLSPEQYDAEKETRVLTRIIGELGAIPRTADSNKILSATHRRNQRGLVFFGRSVVGEFVKNGESNSEKRFVINKESIDSEATRLSIDISGAL